MPIMKNKRPTLSFRTYIFYDFLLIVCVLLFTLNLLVRNNVNSSSYSMVNIPKSHLIDTLNADTIKNQRRVKNHSPKKKKENTYDGYFGDIEKIVNVNGIMESISISNNQRKLTNKQIALLNAMILENEIENKKISVQNEIRIFNHSSKIEKKIQYSIFATSNQILEKRFIKFQSDTSEINTRIKLLRENDIDESEIDRQEAIIVNQINHYKGLHSDIIKPLFNSIAIDYELDLLRLNVRRFGENDIGLSIETGIKAKTKYKAQEIIKVGKTLAETIVHIRDVNNDVVTANLNIKTEIYIP